MLSFLRLLFASFNRMISNCRGTVSDIVVTGASELEEAIPEWWDTKIRLDATKQAFWGKRFEGKQGSRMPIIINNDFTKKAGDIIRFQLMKRLKLPGVTGASKLTGSEEKLSLGQYTLTVEWLRHAVGFNKRGTKRANFDAVRQAGIELADWLARKTDDAVFKQMVITNTPDTIFSGNQTAEDSLITSSVFNTNTLDKLKLALLRKGTIPFQVKNVNGITLKFYGVVIDPIDGFNLRGDEVWQQAQKDANIRGFDNPIFTGALGIYNGMIIFEFGNVAGEFGTYLRPEATLSANVPSSGAVTVTVTVDANTSIDAAEFFAQSSGKIQIGDEVMTYTATGTNSFTVASGGRGALNTTSQAHASGERVTQRNISKQVAFGAEAIVRGWGLFPKSTKDVQDFGFRFGVGIESVFGESVVEDTNGKFPNYLISKSYAENPNVSL